MSIMKKGTMIVNTHRVDVLLEGYETEKTHKFIKQQVWIDLEELIRIKAIKEKSLYKAYK